MIRAVTIRKNKRSPEELVFSSAVHTEVIEKAQALRKDNYLVSLINISRMVMTDWLFLDRP